MLDAPFGFSRRDAVKLTGVLLLAMLAIGVALGFVIGIVIGVSRALHVAPPAWASAHDPVFLITTNVATFAMRFAA